jgi:hypothetical protein
LWNNRLNHSLRIFLEIVPYHTTVCLRKREISNLLSKYPPNVVFDNYLVTYLSPSRHQKYESRRMLLLTPSFLRSAASYSPTHDVDFAKFNGVIYLQCRLDSQFDSTERQGVFLLSKCNAFRAHVFSSGLNWPVCETDH